MSGAALALAAAASACGPRRTPATNWADQDSGELECGFANAQPVVHRRTVAGDRRTDRRVTVDVDSGSGDAAILPLR